MESEGKRVRHACARCRRQKLKCDNNRPCQLCQRSRMTCVEAENLRETRRQAGRNVRRRPLRPAEHHAAAPSELVDFGVVIHDPARDYSRTDSRVHFTERDSQSHASEPVAQPPGLLTPSPRPFTALSEPASTFQLIQQVYTSYDSHPNEKVRLDAIPDSRSRHASPARETSSRTSVSKLLGMRFPPKAVGLALFEAYVSAMDWYMPLFHVPTLRRRIKAVSDNEYCLKSDMPSLLLMFVTMVIGSRFVSKPGIDSICTMEDVSELVSDMTVAIEANVLACSDFQTTDSVIFSYLLSTYYLHTRRTRRSLVLKAATIRAAQAMGLDDETRWVDVSRIERQIRRRLWWMLFISDGYSSNVFGKANVIKDVDFQVELPLETDDELEAQPSSTSDRSPAEAPGSVTVMTYQRVKAKLYLIVLPIMRDLYLCRQSRLDNAIKTAKEIHERLVEWDEQLPLELKLAPASETRGIERDRTKQIFQMQALTLRISYDNMQLLLFRPFLFIPGQVGRFNAFPSNNSNIENNTAIQEILQLSRTQAWKAALRTSYIIEYRSLLQAIGKTSAAAVTGIHGLTAGAVLSVFALTATSERTLQECKRGIARLIRTPAELGTPNIVWSQNAEILKDLLHLVAKQEIDMMTTGSGFPGNSDPIETSEQQHPELIDHSVSSELSKSHLPNKFLDTRRSNAIESSYPRVEDRTHDQDLPSLRYLDSTTEPSVNPHEIEPTTSRLGGGWDSRDDLFSTQGLSGFPGQSSSRSPSGEGSSTQPDLLLNNNSSGGFVFPNLEYPSQEWLWQDSFNFY